MADLNSRLHFGVLALTTEWQIYTASITCRTIEMIADQDWFWCTDKTDPLAARLVGALKREQIIETGVAITAKGEPVIWFKGALAGNIWDKCVR